MNYRLYNLLIAVLALTLASSCKQDGLLDELNPTTVTINIELPELPGEAVVENPKITIHNVTDNSDTEIPQSEPIQLLPGLYDISYHATVITPGQAQSQLRGMNQSVVVGSSDTFITIKVYQSVNTDDLIISEIFYTGTLQPSGNPYYGDDYIKLYNNTDHVVYADGLSIVEGKFITSEKLDCTPNIIDEAMTVQAIYTIPGDGLSVPVQPGQYLLLCDNGMDHRPNNPQSFDLSHADFEWYDVSTSPSNMDIDSPVPNLDKWYCYTKSYWMLHNRGLKCYAIARIPMERDKYLTENLYSYNYEVVTVAGTYPMSQTAYKLPNEWIVDAVCCSVPSLYAWQSCSAMLDCGWTYCGRYNNDSQRYFHSVRRRVEHIEPDGRVVLQDTNNSTKDFEPNAKPSEIELQQTFFPE